MDPRAFVQSRAVSTLGCQSVHWFGEGGTAAGSMACITQDIADNAIRAAHRARNIRGDTGYPRQQAGPAIGQAGHMDHVVDQSTAGASYPHDVPDRIVGAIENVIDQAVAALDMS